MNIIISNSSEIPIYEQIEKEIKEGIAKGSARENEILPSVRVLAQDLKISVMTVKKAYDELEAQGYIKTVHGKGSFVLPQNWELLKEEKIKQIEEHIDNIITIAKIANITKEEILELFEYLYGEENENGKCNRN